VDYVIATYTITNARKEVVNFSDSYWKSSIGLIVNSNRSDASTLSEERIRSVMDLDGKTIGVMTNSTTREDFIKYLQNHGIKISPRFVSYRTYDELSEELTRGNIDVFSVDVTILEGYMQEDRKILDDRFATQYYGVAASKDKEGLIEIANIVIDELD
jgi:ABC-type amino acid transport substrate-binding protein